MAFFVIIEKFNYKFFFRSFSDIDFAGQSLFFLLFNVVPIMALKPLFLTFLSFCKGFAISLYSKASFRSLALGFQGWKKSLLLKP